MSREIEPRVTVNVEIPTSFDLSPYRPKPTKAH